MRRRGADGWAYQGFNYPKAVWGGQLKSRMRRLEGQDRADLYKVIGGTNTPQRKLWQQQLARGRREGWYKTMVGEVDFGRPTGARGNRQQDQDSQRPARGPGRLHHRRHRARGGHRGAPPPCRPPGARRCGPQPGRPPRRGEDLRGPRYAQRHGTHVRERGVHPGRLLSGVDTFLGLQISAQEIADDLIGQGFGHPFGPGRSTLPWLLWARNEDLRSCRNGPHPCRTYSDQDLHPGRHRFDLVAHHHAPPYPGRPAERDVPSHLPGAGSGHRAGSGIGNFSITVCNSSAGRRTGPRCSGCSRASTRASSYGSSSSGSYPTASSSRTGRPT